MSNFKASKNQNHGSIGFKRIQQMQKFTVFKLGEKKCFNTQTHYSLFNFLFKANDMDTEVLKMELKI